MLAVLCATVAAAADLLPGAQPGLGLTQLAAIGLAVLLAAALALPIEWNAGLLLALVSGGLAVAGTEAMLQIASPIRWGTIYRTHPEYLFELIPSSNKFFRHQAINGGRRILVEINRRGFRGAELRQPKTGKRVVVYGDSFIEGEFSNREDTFVERLGRRLAEGAGVPVEAVNAGVVSYGPDQISVRLDHEFGELEPDLVVVAVFAGNDFGDLLRNKIFALDGDSALVKHAFVLSDSLVRTIRQANRRLVLVNLISRVRYRYRERKRLREGAPAAEGTAASQTSDRQLPENPYDVVEEALRDSRLEYQDYVVDRNPVVTNLLQDHYDADISLEPASASARYKVRLMGEVLKRIGATAAEYRVPLLFLLIPSPIDAVEGYDGGQVDPARHPDYRRSELTDALERSLANAGLHYVDLFEPFRREDATRLYYHGFDNHWNERGQDLAARLVTSYILEHGMLAR